MLTKRDIPLNQILAVERLGELSIASAPKITKKVRDDSAKEKFHIWFNTPLRQPRSLIGMARQLGISPPTIQKWKKEIEQAEKDYSSGDYFRSRKKEIDQGMVESVKRGNAQMAKLIKQMSGEFVEKSEITHTVLTADDYSRLSREAEDELRNELQRIREVSPESSLLPL